MFAQFGLNDSAPGALLPYLEAHYKIGYGTISLIFVANAAGFIVAAFVTNRLNARLSRSKVLMLGMLTTVVAYLLLVCTPPFALVVTSFFLAGLGNALCLALTNGWIAGLVNATVLLGLSHASYGIGGILGPLVATAIVGSGRRWSVFYFLTLSLAVINCSTAFLSFRGFEAESASTEPLFIATERPELGSRAKKSLWSRVSRRSQLRNSIAPSSKKPNASLLQALKSRVVLLGAWFIFSYQGAEVTLSGWVLSFLLTSRAHSPSQSVSLGYITSGFWAGITLGRVVLTPPAQRIGEKFSVVALLVFATALQFIVWFVPNIFADAVAVAIVGLLLGPVYPCATVVFSKLLTKDELVPALSIVTALGSSGGAVGPFVTGALGQKTGAWVLNPIVVGLIGCMLACWFGLPRVVKRVD
jgi:fucose permease